MTDNQNNSDIVSAWVKDGTAAQEPVTVETPVAEPVEQPRTETGQFAPQTPEPEASQAAAVTPSATVPTPPAPGASPSVEFIEAKLADGSVFQIPKTVTLPAKRSGKIEYLSAEEVLADGMRLNDYKAKTAEAATVRRNAEAEQTRIQAEAARLDARAQFIAEQEAAMTEAQKDPEKWEQWQQHLTAYQTNPTYRANVDAALKQRETEAENAVYRERDIEDTKTQTLTAVVGWITDLAAQYPAVDPERVRVLYGQQLQTGQARLEPTAVRAIFESETSAVNRIAAPLQEQYSKQVADLQAQLDALKASNAAETRNSQTSHAVQRAKVPPVNTGQAPAPSRIPERKPFGPRELADRNRDWAKQR